MSETQIILPPTTPRPTKKQIVDAMVLRARERLVADNEAREKAYEKAKEALKKECLKVVRRRISTLDAEINRWPKRVVVEIAIPLESDAIIKALDDECRALSGGYYTPTDSALRRDILAAMNAEKNTAVQAILASPEAVAAIDQHLNEFGLTKKGGES